MITAETISNEQIRELRRAVVNDSEIGSVATDMICNLITLALDDGQLPFRIIRNARARCAELLNERALRTDSIGTCRLCGYEGPGPSHDCGAKAVR